MSNIPEVEAILPELLAQVEASLAGSNLAGAYLYGSSVSGDFIEGNSDIDLLIVLGRALSEREFLQLRRMHSVFELARPAWRDRIEVQYVSRESLLTFKTNRYEMAVISPGEKFHRIEAGIDWIQNWYDVRENGRTERGPRSMTIIPKISTAEFVAGIVGYVREHLERSAAMPAMCGTQAYAVLTMCRALYTRLSEKQISKGAAAVWAQNELPEFADLIDWSARLRSGPKQDQYRNSHETIESSKQFVRLVAARILDGIDSTGSQATVSP